MCTMPSSMPRRNARFAASARAPRSGTFQVPWPTIGTSRSSGPKRRAITRRVTPSWQIVWRHGRVFGREARFAVQRPGDPNARVAPRHAALGGGLVGDAVLVVDDGVVLEREKGVAEPHGHEQLLVVATRQLEAFPLQVGRRTAPQVDDRVPD